MSDRVARFAALATFNTYQAAADALGVQYQAFARRIRMARRRFFALWHEGETPSGMWRYDRRQDRTVGFRKTPFLYRRQAAA